MTGSFSWNFCESILAWPERELSKQARIHVFHVGAQFQLTLRGPLSTSGCHGE